jgi:hypothetical protein
MAVGLGRFWWSEGSGRGRAVTGGVPFEVVFGRSWSSGRSGEVRREIPVLRAA